ncbi:MAG: helix-turn-helix domain-containing protein [Mediterranea sp.]|jgi:HTH-type transcriptional regulator/antitoxin HigA|nr:helix-turn-helix domain-containing protein [Mediterranea sp.]
MVRIQNEIAYKAALERIEELLPLVDDSTPLTDKNLIELDLMSGLVEEYEDEHYPIKSPSLAEVIKLRMFEMGLNQAKLSGLLGVSPSLVSDYLTGKREPTLKIAREMSRKLNIDANIVLGV